MLSLERLIDLCIIVETWVMGWRPDLVGDEADSVAKNEPFLCEDKARDPGDKAN